MAAWLNMAWLPAAGTVPVSAQATPGERQSYQRAQARTAPAAGTVQAHQRDSVRQSAALRTPAGAGATRPAPPRLDGRRAVPPGGKEASAPQRHADPVAAGTPAGSAAPPGRNEESDGMAAHLGQPGADGSAGRPEDLAQALTEKIAALAPGETLFELLLPGQQRLAVLVAADSGGLQVWLTPGDTQLRQQLSGRRMELEGALARRMGQAARITVL